MIGMYAVYFLYTVHHVPLLIAFVVGIATVALAGVALHQFIIRPVLASEPINQLLVTGGMPAGAAVRRASVHRPHFRADHLHDLRARRAGQHGGWLHRRLYFRAVDIDRRFLLSDRVGLRHGVRVFHRHDVHPAAGAVGPEELEGLIHDQTCSRLQMNRAAWIALGLFALVPLLGVGDYYLHIAITIMLWSFVYTSWSLMGRFGLVSFGHGAFLGIGAYVTTMLWNHYGVTPWIGIPLALLLAVVVAVLIGYPCFRFRITGHYFALVTLALTEVVRMLMVALRDFPGGSLGVTANIALAGGQPFSLWALQFAHKEVFFYIALAFWLFGLYVWRRIDGSMMRYAMEAISQEEDASESVGIYVTRTKLLITAVSAALTALGGALYGQYQLYINPDTVSGVALSLQIVFAVIAGGMFVQLGPTVGAAFTLLLAEGLRVAVGHDVHGFDSTIYGLMLVLFIIYMPHGILGKVLELRARKAGAAAAAGD